MTDLALRWFSIYISAAPLAVLGWPLPCFIKEKIPLQLRGPSAAAPAFARSGPRAARTLAAGERREILD